MDKRQIEIEGRDNPSRADIIEAFVNAHDSGNKGIAFFSGDGVLEIKVTGLEYESGGPGMFIISGYSISPELVFGYPRGSKVNGFYDANRRTGHLTIG